MKIVSSDALIRLSALLFSGLVFILYATTSYQTVSFWDSGEFIISAATLQIPHAPGSPLFALMGRVLACFAFQNPDYVVSNIHALSWLGGAVTVFFLFLFSAEIVKKMLEDMKYVPANMHTFITIVSGITGTGMLACSDTFWRLSTEAEVYSLAAAFFSAALYFIWEYKMSGNLKCLFLAVFLIGLGATAHLTVLLVLPVLVWSIVVRHWCFYHSSLITLLFLTLIISGAIILWVTKFLPESFVSMDVFIVNSLALTDTPGWGILIAYVCVLILCIAGSFALKYRWLFFSLFLLHLGLSPYALIPIRASANIPFNIGAGKDAESFRHYLAREDFGIPPLMLGYDFTQKIKVLSKGRYSWNSNQNKYERVSDFQSVKPDEKPTLKFFPRLYHPDYTKQYNIWFSNNRESTTNAKMSNWKPDVLDHLHFFVSYQLGDQFIRYLGWNLIGRKHDAYDSPVITGVGYRFNHPAVKHPPGRSPYYMLPFILSICGFLSLMLFSGTGFRFWLIWFIMTGPILVILINMTPAQVRERDYIFQLALMAASWIGGMSFPMISGWILHYFRKEWVYAITPLILAVPVIQFTSGFNSHNASNSKMAYDFAKLTLDACPKDAILFTGGDNDAFPIWCLQHVYGIRKDVTVLNINLLDMKWYVKSIAETQTKLKSISVIQSPDSLFANSQYPSAGNIKNNTATFHSLMPPGKTIMHSIMQAHFDGALQFPICYSSLIEKDYIRKYATRFVSLGMISLMNKDTVDIVTKPIEYFISNCQHQLPISSGYQNFTERSFKWKVSNVILELGLQNLDKPKEIRRLMDKMDVLLPVNVAIDLTKISATRGVIWFHAGDTTKAIKRWSAAGYKSHGLQCWYKYKGWNDLLTKECNHFQDLEKMMNGCSPIFVIKHNWLKPYCGSPCE
jgi:hypothetical protein